MRWFRWRARASEGITGHVTVALEEIYRNMLYDGGFENPEAICRQFGITPVSDEGAEMMAKDSERRREAIEPVAPILQQQAYFAAAAMVELYRRVHDEGELDDDDAAQLFLTYQAFAHATLQGALATLHDTGLVHLHHELVSQ